MVINMKKTNNSKKVSKVWVVICAAEFALVFLGFIFDFVQNKCFDAQVCAILAFVSMMFCAEWEIYKNKKLAAKVIAE